MVTVDEVLHLVPEVLDPVVLVEEHRRLGAYGGPGVSGDNLGHRRTVQRPHSAGALLGGTGLAYRLGPIEQQRGQLRHQVVQLGVDNPLDVARAEVMDHASTLPAQHLIRYR